MNNSSNISNTFELGVCSFDTFTSRLDAFLLIFITLLAIVGNLIVFICYYKYRPLRRITNIYILSLSASDLLVAFVSVPFTFAVLLCNTYPQIKEKKLQNLIYMVCDMVPSILSIYALALVAVDRALAITKPFWHRKYMNNKRASISVFLMWMYVFGLVSLIFVMDTESFTMFIIVMAYAVPVMIMILSYVVMGIVAKKHAKELSSLERTRTRLRGGSVSKCSDNSYSNNSTGSESPYATLKNSKLREDAVAPLVCAYNDNNRLGDNLNRRGSWLRTSIRRFSVARIRTRSSSIVSGMKILKRELKAALTLSLILGCFIISWTPFIALNIEFYRCPGCNIPRYLIKYFKTLHFSNSALNPILYILLNKRWRSAFQIVIMRRKKNLGCNYMSDSSNVSTGTSGW